MTMRLVSGTRSNGSARSDQVNPTEIALLHSFFFLKVPGVDFKMTSSGLVSAGCGIVKCGATKLSRALFSALSHQDV